jgi:hypothetical protein
MIMLSDTLTGNAAEVPVYKDLQTSDTETSIELNFAVLKFKNTIKKKKK